MAECIKPAALWKLEEIGTTIEFQNEVNPGGDVGACRQENGVYICPQSESARYGNGQRFYTDQRPTGIDISSSQTFNWQGKESFSISFWMKRDNTPFDRNEVVIGRDSHETNNELHWWIGVDSTGVANATWRDKTGDGVKNLRGDKLITDNRWHHIVFVREGVMSESRLFVDGVLEDKMVFTYDASDAFSADATDLNIGWIDLPNGYYYKGVLDEIAIYDIALPQWFIHDRYHADERYSADQADPCDEVAGP